MSRKRVLKKQQKRQESALAQLDELARRGADDEFIARAAEQVKDPAASPVAVLWAEVADRALRQSLASADLDRTERLLRSLRRAGRLRPLAVLTEAVLDLAAGRLEAARSRLAALAGMEGAGGEIPPGLLSFLQSLALDVLPESPYLQAAGEVFSALQQLAARDFAPDAADREALAHTLEALRTAAPAADGELLRLLDGAGQCLSLLTDLAALESRLAGLPAPEPQDGSLVAGWLRGPGPMLATTLSASGPSLLAPLRQAVRLRWRAVLERVAAREGSPGLAALYAAEPRLLALDIDLPPGGLAALRQAAEAKQLLAAGRRGDLARLLRDRSRSASDHGGDLAALWSLELWASHSGSPDDQEEVDDDGPESFFEPPPHRILVRLQEMAAEIGRRIPAEQRTAVARMLRGELLDLCERIHFCEHTAGTALSLLDHLPGDAGLLIAGLAGAFAQNDSRLRRALETRLPLDSRIAAEDLPVAQRLMAQVALEDPEAVPRILDGVRPLFAAGAWPAIAALVAREMSDGLARALRAVSIEVLDDPGLERLALGQVRRDIDRLRPTLAGTPGFSVMELALDCWRPDPIRVERQVEKFLAAFPGAEEPLTALRMLSQTMGPGTPSGIAMALRGLAHAAIDRLDDRWQVWIRDVPLLAIPADKPYRRRLDKKIRKLLASPEVQGDDREILAEALSVVQRIDRERESRRKPAIEPPKPRSKKVRTGHTGLPQLRLDL